MSIPLDRLYNYLQDCVNRDTLIYRWCPHGSKKLSDLQINENLHFHDRKFLTSVAIICHDQEPLDYDFYQIDDLVTMPSLISGIESKNFVDVCYNDIIGWACGAAISLYDKTIITHSELNSKEVIKYQNNGYVPVFFWSHGIIARDWFRYAEHDQRIQHSDSPKYDFLIYNRAWSGTREYRLKFIELLISSELASHCLTSFCPNDCDTHYKDHVFKNQNFSIDRYDFENILPLNVHSSTASGDYVSNDYCESGIEVVLETLFDDERIYLTEKVLRPIACGKPFILVSTPGSLKFLKKYGFRTFEGLIDESYDNIKDPSQRLQAIISEMQRIAKLPQDEKSQLITKLNNIAEENKKLFFSENFHNTVMDEFNTNYQPAYAEAKASLNGTNYKKLYTVVCERIPDRVNEIYPPINGVSDMEWIDQWIATARSEQ